MFFNFSSGFGKIIDILIQNEAKVDDKDQNGWTPLFYASASGDEKVIEQLVKNGADINLKDNNETTNLHSATFLGIFQSYSNSITVKKLINNIVWFQGDGKTVEILVRNNADVNIENKNGETALHIATFIGK